MESKKTYVKPEVMGIELEELMDKTESVSYAGKGDGTAGAKGDGFDDEDDDADNWTADTNLWDE